MNRTKHRLVWVLPDDEVRKSLEYSASMKERRRTAGRRIFSARRARGFKSQKAFALSAGISEGSVANAERGASGVGSGVYASIEAALGWPEECIVRYLESGDESLLPSRTQDRTPVPSLAEMETMTGAEVRKLYWRLKELRGESFANTLMDAYLDSLKLRRRAADGEKN